MPPIEPSAILERDLIASCDFPLSGRAREELAAGLRSYFVRPRYHIFYRVKGEQLEIVHVLHHARDLSRFFPDD
jgi:plasmid stabilization system protein ParE